jgi:catechol 2,3-dioxygenase-like lactoylglutathione lyase family enzyme
MKERIENLLDDYERGSVTRTQLVEALAAMAAAPQSRPASSVFRGRTLNHITLKVSHLERSRDFYQEMFGLAVTKQTDDGYNLGLEDSFLGIYQTNNAGLDHVCIGIAEFQFDLVMEKLKQGPPSLKPTCRGQRIFLQDPDGIRIQLSSVDYRGL